MAIKKSSAKQTRVYKGSVQFDQDLYKLQLAHFVRNRALPNEALDWERVEHVHHFRSVDSDGKVLNQSTKIAGHFHEMIVEESEDGGGPKVMKCGPPLREVRKRVNGRMIRTSERISHDNHIHEVAYEKSVKIDLRKTNPDAVNMVAADANRGAPIPGVFG